MIVADTKTSDIDVNMVATIMFTSLDVNKDSKITKAQFIQAYVN